MKIAKLPNGLKIQFPDNFSDEDMDDLVQKYITSTEASVQKYLLNEEALQGIVKIGETMAQALEGFNKLMVENQKQQSAMVEKLDEVLKGMVAAKPEKLQKSIDVLANTNHAAFTKVAKCLDGLTKAVKDPIKFSYDAKGNLVGAE